MLLILRKQPEAAAMTRWGVRIARATEKPLHILWVESGHDSCDVDLEWKAWGTELLESDPDWECVADALADCGTMDIQLCRSSCRSRHLTVLATERKLSPELILVGRHNSSRDGSVAGKLARELLDEAYSAVLVLRLGSLSEDGDEVDTDPAPGILVPCAGGQHSRLGMTLAAKIAGEETTALYVESDVDDLSKDVGHEHLRRTLKRAGVASDSVSSKVVLSEKVSDAISRELNDGDYGLMLIGAAGGGTLRRKLFGTVPQRLMQGSEGMSIGVIRAARPAGWRLRERAERWMCLSVPQLKRDERIQLFAEIEGKSRWSFDFAVLMILSTAIAGLGLLSDSGAVVIGAMLVAPLMMPLLGGGLSLVQGNWLLWKQCVKSVLLGFLCALVIGFSLGLLAQWMNVSLTSELLARGEPTLMDLGVAFFSGIAASYCLARPGLTGALAGVAIAAALVPPIATTGICLAMGEMGVAKGSALLFGTNVVAIVLGSALNFLMAGVRGKKTTPRVWARRLAIALALVGIGMSVPLASVLVSRASSVVSIEQSLREQLDLNHYQLLSSQLSRKPGGGRQLDIYLEGPEFPSAEVIAALRSIAEERYGDDVKMRIRLSLARDVNTLSE